MVQPPITWAEATRVRCSPCGKAAIARFAAAGLDGIEAFYATHDEPQTRALYAAARERGLLATGSADFHGPAHDRFDRFGAFELYGLEPVLTGKIGSTAITNGVVTCTQAASAIGSVFSATPTAANTVAAGDNLNFTLSGTQDAAVGAVMVVVVKRT